MIQFMIPLVEVAIDSTSSHSSVEESPLELKCFVVGSGAMPQTPTAILVAETTSGDSSSLNTMTPS